VRLVWPLVIAIFAAPSVPASDPGDPALRVLQVGGARLTVVLPRHRLDVADDAVLEWVAAAAGAVAAYQGRFPVPSATVRIRVHAGRGIGSGSARCGASPEIRVSVGNATLPEDLRHDWVLTHEMVHLGFPSLDDQHHWMEEGLATYLEPVARARAGLLSPEEAWGKLVVFLPKGLPGKDDRGLDRTPTWGRTYWGGAAFWLLCDVEIRRRTHGRKGLEDVLRAVVAANGTLGAPWDVEEVIETGDVAVGAPILRELYQRLAITAAVVDLEELWHSLGVGHEDGAVVLNDQAPLAPIRRAITGAGPAAAVPGPGPRPPPQGGGGRPETWWQ
jgi:hypothetical protein